MRSYQTGTLTTVTPLKLRMTVGPRAISWGEIRRAIRRNDPCPIARLKIGKCRQGVGIDGAKTKWSAVMIR